MAGFTGSDGFCFGAYFCQCGLNVSIEVFRQFFIHTAHKFCGFDRIFGLILSEEFVPFGLKFRTFFFCIPCCIDFLRNFKRRISPTQMFARSFDFVRAQRCAVGFVATLFVGAAFAD